MGGSVYLSGVRRRCGMLRVVPVAAVRAGLFAVLGTAVAGTVHHLAFDASPSWSVRVLASLLLFGVALPGAGHDKPLLRQLTLAVAAQAVVGYWFVLADDALTVHAHGVWPSSVHAGLPVVVGHLLLTVLSAALLRGMDTCRRRVLYAAGRALLRRLLAPIMAPLGLSGHGIELSPVHGDDRASPTVVFLADAVVRRGPPSFSLPLAA